MHCECDSSSSVPSRRLAVLLASWMEPVRGLQIAGDALICSSYDITPRLKAQKLTYPAPHLAHLSQNGFTLFDRSLLDEQKSEGRERFKGLFVSPCSLDYGSLQQKQSLFCYVECWLLSRYPAQTAAVINSTIHNKRKENK